MDMRARRVACSAACMNCQNGAGRWAAKLQTLGQTTFVWQLLLEVALAVTLSSQIPLEISAVSIVREFHAPISFHANRSLSHVDERDCVATERKRHSAAVSSLSSERRGRRWCFEHRGPRASDRASSCHRDEDSAASWPLEFEKWPRTDA